MPQYVVEALEIHVQKYRVEAQTPAEAVFNFYHGDGEEVGPSGMIEMSMDHGLPVDEYANLVDGLTALGEKVVGDIIVGIRDVAEIENERSSDQMRSSR